MTPPSTGGHAVATASGFFGEALTAAESDDTTDELAALTARVRRPQVVGTRDVRVATPSPAEPGIDASLERQRRMSVSEHSAGALSPPPPNEEDVGAASMGRSAGAQAEVSRRAGAPRRPANEPSEGRLARASESMGDQQPSQSKVPVVFQLPASLTVACKDWSRLNGVTYADLVLAAVDAHHEQVPDLLHLAAPKEQSLFARRPARVPRHTEALAQFTAQMLPSEVKVLDDLVVHYGTPSRAQLVGACLREFLRLEGSRV